MEETKKKTKIFAASVLARVVAWQPKTDLLVAAACLLGVIAIYAICMLVGEPFNGYDDRVFAVETRLLRLIIALGIAFLIGLFVTDGLSENTRGWERAVAVVLLVAPVVLACHTNATGQDLVLVSLGIPTWWVGTTLWPVLAALLAHLLLAGGGRPGAGRIALYAGLSFVCVTLLVCNERYHDFIEYFYMCSIAIAAGFVAMGGSERAGRKRAIASLVAIALAAVVLSVVTDWRFYEILGTPGTAKALFADHMESLRRFLTFVLDGWDCVAYRNALFHISATSGPIAALAYVALSLTSAVFMASACRKLACRMEEGGATPSSFAVGTYGIAYAVFMVIGIGAELLNINTRIQPVYALAIAPATTILMVVMLGWRALKASAAEPGDECDAEGLGDEEDEDEDLSLAKLAAENPALELTVLSLNDIGITTMGEALTAPELVLQIGNYTREDTACFARLVGYGLGDYGIGQSEDDGQEDDPLCDELPF
jgi:hypothetical protein